MNARVTEIGLVLEGRADSSQLCRSVARDFVSGNKLSRDMGLPLQRAGRVRHPRHDIASEFQCSPVSHQGSKHLPPGLCPSVLETPSSTGRRRTPARPDRREQGSPTCRPQAGTSLWPIRNRATQQQVRLGTEGREDTSSTAKPQLSQEVPPPFGPGPVPITACGQPLSQALGDQQGPLGPSCSLSCQRLRLGVLSIVLCLKVICLG